MSETRRYKTKLLAKKETIIALFLYIFDMKHKCKTFVNQSIVRSSQLTSYDFKNLFLDSLNSN